MKNLVFYPTFEPQNEEWLKYALIYVENFSPIIPQNGEKKLTDNFKKIKDETDLLKIIQPPYEQASLASFDTIKEIESIEKTPDFYRDLFNVANILRKFQDRENWTYEIFVEKFTYPLQEILTEREYACQSPNGIYTSMEMAQLFMTFLANRIAQKGNTNPITDTTKFNTLSLALNEKNKTHTDSYQNLAKTIIDIKLPDTINKIPLERFIEFRNTDGIVELRQNFNNDLNKFYNSIEGDYDPNDFINSLCEYEKSIAKEILLFFGSISVISIDAITSIIGGEKLEILKDLIKIAPIIKSVATIKSSYKDESEKMKGRKFLTLINKI